jgi:CheY-like chemotaxis protein
MVAGFKRAARILVVDDDPLVLKIVTSFLAAAGHQVHAVLSAEEALESLHRSAFDLAVLDLHMPVMDGFELCARIRAMEGGSRLPILFLTAHYNGDEWSVRSRELGADDFVSKPITRRALEARVHALLRLSWGASEAATHAGLRALFEALLEEVPACVLALDAEGRILGAAGKIEEILGDPPPAGAMLEEVLPEKITRGEGLGGLLSSGPESRELEWPGPHGPRKLRVTLRRVSPTSPLALIQQVMILEDLKRVEPEASAGVVELGVADLAAAAAAVAGAIESQGVQVLGQLRILQETGERVLRLAENLALSAPGVEQQRFLASLRSHWREALKQSAVGTRSILDAARELRGSAPGDA